MPTRWIAILALAAAAVAIGWALNESRQRAERTDLPGESREIRDAPAAPTAPAPPDKPANESESASPVDVQERARFNERAREFFAQAPALSGEEARQRAAELSQELSRIEQAGGMSAGETFLLRGGLIRYTAADEQEQVAQLRALRERYAADTRQRSALAASQTDPMFQLYKVRESQIVAETLSLQSIPNGLSREEYLRQRLQAEREQLLGEGM